MDEGERARRLVQKLRAHQDSGEFAQMIALKDEAIQLSAALAHITTPGNPRMTALLPPFYTILWLGRMSIWECLQSKLTCTQDASKRRRDMAT